jgi:hypothetical protein
MASETRTNSPLLLTASQYEGASNKSPRLRYENITYMLSRVRVTLDGVLDWILDLLTTYTRDSELQAINSATVNLPTIHKPPQHSLDSLLRLRQPFPGNGFNNGNSSASALKSSLNGGSLPTLFQLSLFFTDSLTELTCLSQLSSL